MRANEVPGATYDRPPTERMVDILIMLAEKSHLLFTMPDSESLTADRATIRLEAVPKGTMQGMVRRCLIRSVPFYLDQAVTEWILTERGRRKLKEVLNAGSIPTGTP